MAAMLATLEGNEKGITLDDLFDVNDYLGVKYFGPEDWNRVKKCACIITMKAAKNPVLFYIDSLKDDYKDYKPSELANRVFGFNDAAGVELMGSIPWERLKVKMDNELLGWPSIGGIASKIGGAISAGAGMAYDAAKTVATAPLTIGEKIWTETPLKDTPGGKWYKKQKEITDKVLSVAPPLKEIHDDPIQYVTDKSSKILYDAATKTPLKYTGYGLVTKLVEKSREKAGITSPGTAEVNPTEEEIIRQKRAAAEAAARAASAASTAKSKEITAAKKLQAEAEQKAAAEAAAAAAAAEQAATQNQLEQTQAVLTSKYAPWVLGGAGLLLALSILKK